MSFFRYKNNRDFQKGFTLLEVLAALVLLSLVLSWLIPAFIQILDSNTKAEHQLEAYLLGYGKLEEIIGRAETAQEGRFPPPWSGYNWYYQEEKNEELLSQTLTVKWKDHGYERQVLCRKARINID